VGGEASLLAGEDVPFDSPTGVACDGYHVFVADRLTSKLFKCAQISQASHVTTLTVSL
jgi:hypothetical protein